MKKFFDSSKRGIPKKLNKLFGILFMVFLFFQSMSLQAQDLSVNGKVVDQNGDPVIGANVVIKGTTTGTITNADGEYLINCGSNDILVFSFIGMEIQEVPVDGRSSIDILLNPSVEAMEEVVVVGYGVQKKESVIGAVSQISGEKIKSVKMGGSLENTLQGNLPGLTVIMTDPTPGEEAMGNYYAAAPIQMLIRGTASMGNNSPLVIVDGVERSLSNIDPNDVSSVSILKDASATAVYGVKGANGVIIITTKRGRSGAMELEFTADFTMKTPTMLPEYMNSYETMLLRNEAYRNDGMWDLIISDEELMHYKNQDLPYLYPDFDWMEFLFEPAYDQSYNLNARGGNDFVQYFSSIGYLNEGDIFTLGNDFPYDYDNKNGHYFHHRYTFRNNLDFQLSKSSKLSVNLGGNIKEWGKPNDTFTQELWFEPVTTMPYYPEEALEMHPDELIPYNQTGLRPMINPDQGNVRLLWMGGKGFYRFKSNQINTDVIFNQKLDRITPGLSFGLLYSYNSNTIYRKSHQLPSYFGYYLDPETEEWTRYNETGKVNYDTPQPPLNVQNDGIFQSTRSHYYEAKVMYDRVFGSHALSGIGVFSRRKSNLSIADFPHYEENWVGRLTYNFDEKYFAEVSVAHTGSEKFAPGLRYGTFPAFATSWLISNEDFFSSVKPILNRLKLRYSWGKVGSDAGIDRWLYVSEYEDVDGGIGFGFPVQNYPWIQEGNIPITDATWETATKQNIGIELGFLENLISLEVDLFDERRTDMLMTRNTVPSWVGIGGIQGNLGETKAHGIEIVLGIDKVFRNGLYLYAEGNVALTENRVVNWDESESVPFHFKAEGKPVDIAARMGSYTPGTGLEDKGYYQDFDELFMWGVATGGNPIVGDLKFLDFNGDGNVDEQDRIVSEDPTVPHTTWSAKLGASYKAWTFEANFYGISSVARPMRQGGMFYLFPFTQNKDNAYTAHGDHWTPTNTNASFPAVHYMATNQYNQQISQFAMIPGKYIRLRNVRLGYSLDAPLLGKIGIKQMDLGLVGTNLLTWKELDWGGDPEGFNFGVDFGAYPQTRRYTFEIRLTF